MKKIFLNIVILFSALSSINVFANNPEPSIQLQAWIESKMQHDNIPGASIAVVKNYQLKWAKGYSIHEKIPTLIEELNGEPPANTPAIIVIRQPGTKYEYSPAGYTIIQQVLEDIYPQPFAEIMQQLILNPLSMQHSTFMSPLPKKYLSDVAMPYLPNGKPLANGPFSFTAAAGGLWTTPTDLAKFLIAIQ